jgi:hypothetical protein
MKKRSTFVLLVLLSVLSQTLCAQITAKDTVLNVKFNRDSTLSIDIKKNDRFKITIQAQKAGTEPSGFASFIEHFQLRKTFQAVKDKEDAAFVNLVYPKDTAGSQNFAFALGYSCEFGVSQIKPFIEWQRNTLTDKKQNVFLAGASFQTYFWTVGANPFWAPLLISSVNYKHDNEKSSEGTQASLYLSPIFYNRQGRFYPLPDAYNENNILTFFYNLYAGAEFENRAQAELASQRGNVARLYLGPVAHFTLPQNF